MFIGKTPLHQTLSTSVANIPVHHQKQDISLLWLEQIWEHVSLLLNTDIMDTLSHVTTGPLNATKIFHLKQVLLISPIS